jgi:AcrR family transcriptional regulator
MSVCILSSVSATKRQTPAAHTDGRQAELRGTARERLLEAAAAEFVERGYAGASLQAIARRAGLTRGAIYWNFKNKQELFLTLLDERIDEPARALMRLTENAPAGQGTAATVSEGLAHLISNQAALVMLLFEHWAAAARDPTLRRAFNARQHDLADTLARALAARHATTGVPLTYPAERLATAVLALGYGSAMIRLVDPGAIPDELLGEVLDLLYDGLVQRAESGVRPPRAARA